ncbi:GHMP kinase [Magnetospirillum sp. SS-4]|uniref:GHMP family kinase ATP-binding protein n=1 Tax=Magnetospirillum sp. SS-4 TaxID=2681465 RepID=UPI001384B360|nr:GHMP kinase [Magnetospirillum sp. SS-4]CAA7614506.1 GHMP kinase [Magnetospirillum sp. SS-4]
MPRQSNSPRIVMTAVPLRLSFAGGGTDIADFYLKEGGAVLSTTIDKFVYVTVKSHGELYREPYRLNYYNAEHAQDLDSIKNDIMRECLRLVPVEPPLYVSTVADVPSSSGLGSSSSFAVGLLHALHVMRGDRVSLGRLAEEACHIEINVLKQPIGKQDQYAAAFGGLNCMRFETDGRVVLEPQTISADKIRILFDHLMLFWTNTTRSASEILTRQRQAIDDRMANLRSIKAHCEQVRHLLNGDFDPAALGGVLDETWRQKRGITEAISNSQIDQWYEIAMAAGATGGKIAGAGGGGFLLLIVPPDRQPAVAEALKELDRLPIRYEASGTRVLIPLGH